MIALPSDVHFPEMTAVVHAIEILTVNVVNDNTKSKKIFFIAIELFGYKKTTEMASG